MNNEHVELLVEARKNVPQVDHYIIENVTECLTEIWDDIRLDEYDRLDEHLEEAIGELEYANELGLGDVSDAVNALKKLENAVT